MNARICLALLVVAIALAGCSERGERLEDGEVHLQWLVGPHGCDDAETPWILVGIQGEDSRVGARQWQFACDAGEGVVAGLDPGSYVFVLRGIDIFGRPTFIGDTGRVDVRPSGATRADAVRLAAKPASVTVRWDFGGPLCATLNVVRVEVLAFDIHGTIEAEAAADCENAEATIDLRPGHYDIVVQGVDQNGLILYEAIYAGQFERGDVVVESRTLLPVE